MRLFYNILTHCAIAVLWVGKYFNPKLKLFVNGRKNSFEILQNKIGDSHPTIWFHCASLGEYEQGVPIMKAVKQQYPSYKIIVTFFSPSGYENKKDSSLADAVVYLPMDTRKNANKFLAHVRPSLAVFIKYEFWPNYLYGLQKNIIPTLLISGVFRSDQIFFKSYGIFMRKALQTIDYFFLQDSTSEELLNQIGIHQTEVSGDTRFDRVSQQIEQDNYLSFMEDFKKNTLCVVCGSTWPEDEIVLQEYINSAPKGVTFVIAPHKIERLGIENFRNKLKSETLLYSEIQGKVAENFSVLIIDTIGLLTKIYSYADIAYVGGAMGKTGLHNILEPATFGVPVVIGKHYTNFPEAKRLRSLAGLFSVSSAEECSDVLNKLITDATLRNKTGMIAGHFVNQNTGATQAVMQYLENKAFLRSDYSHP